jgi:hypothetical protein
VDKIQEEKRMPFVTSYDRVERCIGLRAGIETALKIRFGTDGLKLMPEIKQVYEEEQLLTILKALETATTLEDVRRLWAPSSP